MSLATFVPNDYGPIYVETLLGHSFPVEPWNTASNLVFLAIIVYWSLKMRKRENRSLFIICCLPLLLVGYIGGTAYHATRSHDLWRILDFGPIYALLFMTTVYMWRQLLNWQKALLVTIGVQVAMRANAALAGPLVAGAILGKTLGYVVMGLNLLIPTLAHAVRNRGKHSLWLFAAIFTFGLALFFREMDHQMTSVLSQGSHFLWHTCGGVATHFLVQYIYLHERKVQPIESSMPEPDDVQVA